MNKAKALIAPFLVCVLSVATQAADGEANQTTMDPAEEREVSQRQVRERSGNAPEDPGKGQQRNANSEQEVVRGPEVKEGPYGDKQNHKRQGEPYVAGEQAKPQKGRK